MCLLSAVSCPGATLALPALEIAAARLEEDKPMATRSSSRVGCLFALRTIAGNCTYAQTMVAGSLTTAVDLVRRICIFDKHNPQRHVGR